MTLELNILKCFDKVIVITTGDDFEFETIAPSSDEALRYFENRMTNFLRRGSGFTIKVFSNTVVLSSPLPFEEAFHFLEVDVNDMYGTNLEITKELIPKIKDIIVSHGWDYKDYTRG